MTDFKCAHCGEVMEASKWGDHVCPPPEPTAQEVLNAWFKKHPPKELQEARQKIADAVATLNDALRLIRTFEGIDSE